MFLFFMLFSDLAGIRTHAFLVTCYNSKFKHWCKKGNGHPCTGTDSVQTVQPIGEVEA